MPPNIHYKSSTYESSGFPGDTVRCRTRRTLARWFAARVAALRYLRVSRVRRASRCGSVLGKKTEGRKCASVFMVPLGRAAALADRP